MTPLEAREKFHEAARAYFRRVARGQAARRERQSALNLYCQMAMAETEAAKARAAAAQTEPPRRWWND